MVELTDSTKPILRLSYISSVDRPFRILTQKLTILATISARLVVGLFYQFPQDSCISIGRRFV